MKILHDYMELPAPLWRLISDLKYAQRCGEKQITVDISNVLELLAYFEREEDEAFQNEAELSERLREISRLEDDLLEERERADYLEETLRNVQSKLDQTIELMQGISTK